MRELTITEALAELKTIEKRIAKKATSVASFLLRQDALRDPLERQGGSPAFVMQEMQAISSLEENAVQIRAQIQAINGATRLKVGSIERTIAEWLIWRRDIAPKQQSFFAMLRRQIDDQRKLAARTGATVVPAGEQARPSDMVVNLDEKKLSEDAESLESVLGTLDGLLSLKNATTKLQVA